MIKHHNFVGGNPFFTGQRTLQHPLVYSIFLFNYLCPNTAYPLAIYFVLFVTLSSLPISYMFSISLTYSSISIQPLTPRDQKVPPDLSTIFGQNPLTNITQLHRQLRLPLSFICFSSSSFSISSQPKSLRCSSISITQKTSKVTHHCLSKNSLHY